MPSPRTSRPGHLPRRARPPATAPAWARRRRPSTTRPQRDWIAIAVSSLPGLAALIALVFASLSVRATNGQLQTAEQGQITDRYNAAITNLGSASTDIRLGGIYALQRLMQDSPRDQPTVIAVLCAFIRDHASATASASPSHPPTDIQAALTVVTTRNIANDGFIDLNHTQLINAHLDGADLTGADLTGADLSGAILTRATLKGATLTSAHLEGATLDGAHLEGATLVAADLTAAILTSATLKGAHLEGATLDGAHFDGATLTHAHLESAHLDGATLTRADLTRATLKGATLTSAHLEGATLDSAHLDRAHLTDAHLDGATLRGAQLTGATLTGATLTGADLKGAIGIRTGAPAS